MGMASTATAQSPTLVRVLPESAISGDRVDLASIADISPTPDTDKLGKISLGYAPTIGGTREIVCEQIATSIRAAGFSAVSVDLNCSRPVAVRRRGQTITAEAIRLEVLGSLSKYFAAGEADVRLLRLDAPANITVPIGVLELAADWSGIRNVFAPFGLPVRVKVDGRSVRTIVVNAEIEAWANVLVAARDLAANSELSADDVCVERVRISRPLASYVRDQSKLLGTAATRDLRTGTELTADVLASVSVIKPGDPVRIEAGSGRLKLIVAGEARAAGRIGDRIAVKNKQSGAILQAIVLDRGKVRVSL